MFPYLRVIFFVLSVFLLFIFWNWGGAGYVADTLHPPVAVNLTRVGKPAPNLHVDKTQVWSKQEFQLSQLKGYPVIVHFWATWCGPCLQELPQLLERSKELRKNGYSIVAVAVDENWGKLDDFFSRYPQLSDLKNQAILILDPGGVIAEKFGSSRFPETFLINTNGIIDNKLVGAQPWNDPSIMPYLERLRIPASAQ